jgi:hypothetical protein
VHDTEIRGISYQKLRGAFALSDERLSAPEVIGDNDDDTS